MISDEEKLKQLNREYEFWKKVYRDAPYEWAHNPSNMQATMELAENEMQKIAYSMNSIRHSPPPQQSSPSQQTQQPSPLQQTATNKLNIETDAEREARIEARLFEAELQRRNQKRIAEEQTAERKIRQEQERIAEEQAAEYKVKAISHDQNALARIAQNSYESEILRLATIKILIDKDVLARIAQNSYNFEVLRITAIEKLTDQDVLTRIARNRYNSREVCMAANKRLAEI